MLPKMDNITNKFNLSNGNLLLQFHCNVVYDVESHTKHNENNARLHVITLYLLFASYKGLVTD